MAAVLVEHHSQQLEEQRISSFACRIQAWLGIFVDVDILLGMPNIGYSFFLMERYHWHHLCTMLENQWFKYNSSQFITMFICILIVIRIISCSDLDLRCFWHPATFCGQSQAWVSSLYRRPPMQNCSVAVPFQQVQYLVQDVSCPNIP